MEPISLIIFGVILLVIYFLWGRQKRQSTTSGNQGQFFDQSKMKNNSIYRMYMGGETFAITMSSQNFNEACVLIKSFCYCTLLK
jgi:hypothetical protein